MSGGVAVTGRGVELMLQRLAKMGASLPLPPPRTDWLDPDNEPELAIVADRTAKLVPVEAKVGYTVGKTRALHGCGRRVPHG